MAEVDLETLYLPSRWSKRFSAEEIVGKHVEFISNASAAARKEIPNELDIPYGPLPKEKIDVFGTDLPDDSPLFVFVHGGYWQEECLTRSVYHYLSKRFYHNKVKSMFIGYELCPKVSVKQIVEEVETAIEWCINYALKSGSSSICLVGYSAGCQLVAMTLPKLFKTFEEKATKLIKIVLLLAGIYDLSDLPKTAINLPLNLDETSAKELSPLQQEISSQQIPATIYIIAADEDSPEFKKQSTSYCEKLRAAGVKSNLLVVEKMDHFDLIELMTDPDYQLAKLIMNLIDNSRN